LYIHYRSPVSLTSQCCFNHKWGTNWCRNGSWRNKMWRKKSKTFSFFVGIGMDRMIQSSFLFISIPFLFYTNTKLPSGC